MKKILTVILGIFFISMASAMTLIAGESYTFSANTTRTIYYDVEGNSSNLEGLFINQDIFENYSNITIHPHPLYKPDSFTLIFFEEKIVVDESPGGSSGGGGRGRRIIQNKTVEYKEIPDYITKEVPIEITPKEPEEPSSNEKLYFYTTIFLGLALLALLLILAIKKYKKNDNSGNSNV